MHLEQNAFLVPDDLDGQQDPEKWVQRRWQMFFKGFLVEWYGSIAVLLFMAIFMAWIHYKGRKKRILERKRRNELARIPPKITMASRRKKK
ncbi:hypothetical protein [Duganella vulcania]|uniref:Uncharacterized protein n=1 Tax=Duganella vulcania TaxID=2692166 RepID=A0A845GT85_9BURK|nr:hypothetical protein [Duganella vulcania]MYM96446.1 hypothetical protein [Duganella vulcania]